MWKSLVFTIILTAINYSQQQATDEIDKALDNCIATTGVDPAIAEKAFTKAEFIDDKNFKCFLKCMMVVMGDMTETGQLMPDNMKSRPSPGLTKEQEATVVDKCASTTGSDPCELAYNTAKCMIDEALKLVAGKKEK